MTRKPSFTPKGLGRKLMYVETISSVEMGTISRNYFCESVPAPHCGKYGNSLSHFCAENFVKAAVLLMKLPKELISRNFIPVGDI